MLRNDIQNYTLYVTGDLIRKVPMKIVEKTTPKVKMDIVRETTTEVPTTGEVTPRDTMKIVEKTTSGVPTTGEEHTNVPTTGVVTPAISMDIDAIKKYAISCENICKRVKLSGHYE